MKKPFPIPYLPVIKTKEDKERIPTKAELALKSMLKNQKQTHTYSIAQCVGIYPA